MASPPDKVNRRGFLRRTAKTLVVGGTAVGMYAWRVEPHWIEVVRRDMPLAGLPAAWQGKTLVQISDLHVGPIVSERYLRSAMETVESLQPDLIAVTGDWMTCDRDEQLAKTLDIVAGLPRVAPVVGILGNHDYGESFADGSIARRLAESLRDTGVHLLRNQSIELDGLQIAGTDDLWSGRSSVFRTLAGIDADRPTIAMTHNPDMLDRGGWDDFRGWILSGHTHGGQCWLPGVGAPVTPIRNRRYTAGEVALGDGKTLYVNRALGYKQRVRLLVRPEITVFTLTDAPQTV